MDRDALKEALLQMTKEERQSLIDEVDQSVGFYQNVIKSRQDRLNSKQGCCPHCGSYKYTKYGSDKGSKRYKCKECQRTFTEYTGTWMEGIHKKELLGNYVMMMKEEKSLDKIKLEMKINKKTAFDWRHKILSGLEQSGKNTFQGITESDETFFLMSEKGVEQQVRKPRKRGGRAIKRGISNEQVAVIVTSDRVSEIDMTLACLGRIKKSDIENAIGQFVTGQTILCSDSHVSYKGFAKDKKIEHHAIRSDLKQFVKNKIYHVQHVNSLHSRLKKWLAEAFQGVSTKYLQKYLNWFRIKERLKNSKNYLEDMVSYSLMDLSACLNFKAIPFNYEKLLQ
jgi:transposase-like protein